MKNDHSMTIQITTPAGETLYATVRVLALNPADNLPSKAEVRVYRDTGDAQSGIKATLDAPAGESIDPRDVAHAMSEGVANFAALYASSPKSDGNTDPILLN